MALTLSMVTSSVYEGDLALRVFEAVKIIREKYGIEVIVDFVNNELTGCTAFCGPPMLVLSDGRAVMLSERNGYEPEDLADIIIRLIFGEVESEGGFETGVFRLRGPEAPVGAMASS